MTVSSIGPTEVFWGVISRERLPVAATCPNPSTLTAEAVAEAHQHGMAVWPWTTDEPAEQRRLVEIGADGIMTNRPDVLRKVLDGVLPEARG